MDTYGGIEAINQLFPDQILDADLRLVVRLISFTAENVIARTNALGSGWVPVSVLMLWVTENCVVPPRNRTPNSSFCQVIGASLVTLMFL
jgi:hypothetical protein